jgi:cytochrome c oxidase subunit 4
MSKLNALTRGIVVFAILAVLTALEYILGISEVPAILLWIIGLVKAGLVVWYFMHLPRVFKSEGGHES